MMQNPYMPKPAEITRIIRQTDIDYTFFVKSDMTLKSGQFVQLSVPRAGEAPISVSDFKDGELEMTIRKVGKVTDEIFNKEVGDRLYIRGPYGNGFSPEDHYGKELIVVAGGTGLAPVKNLISHFYDNPGKLKSFRLIVGFKSMNDRLFVDELNKWSQKFPVNITLDRPEEGWIGSTGFVTDHINKMLMKDPENTHVVIVGPPPMMKFTALGFSQIGLRKEQIWMSFERKMSCALGKCGHCKIDETYICLEGPVFRYDKAVNLID